MMIVKSHNLFLLFFIADVEEILSCPADTTPAVLNFWISICMGKELAAIETLLNAIDYSQWFSMLQRSFFLHDVIGLINKDWFKPATDSSVRDHNIVKLILNSVKPEQKMELLLKGREAITILHAACLYQDANTVECILDALANQQRMDLLSVWEPCTHTPLHAACGKGDTRTVECILKSVASDEQRTKILLLKTDNGFTPLHSACTHSNPDSPGFEMAKCVLDSFQDPLQALEVLSPGDEFGLTLLGFKMRTSQGPSLLWLLSAVPGRNDDVENPICMVALNMLLKSNHISGKGEYSMIFDCVNRYTFDQQYPGQTYFRLISGTRATLETACST